MRFFTAFVLLIFFQIVNAQTNNSPDFLAKPYLQLGKRPSMQSMQLVWHTTVSNDVWLAEYRNSGETEWRRSESQTFSTIAVGNIAPLNVYSTTMTSLPP